MIPKAETMPENHVSANYKIIICGNDIFFIVFADYDFIICGTRNTNNLCINWKDRFPKRPIPQKRNPP